MLTGESIPVIKTAIPLNEESKSYNNENANKHTLFSGQHQHWLGKANWHKGTIILEARQNIGEEFVKYKVLVTLLIDL